MSGEPPRHVKPYELPRRVGPYEILKLLGRGGMGEVYLARSPDGTRAAVKVIRQDLAAEAGFRRRFAREVAAARRVHGAYTAQVLDADPDGAQPWMATAYVSGPSLADAVADHGPFPEESLRVLAWGLVEALAAIHAVGLVHRDLKPNNILIAIDGPRVVDFGIAFAEQATTLTRSGAILGTPGYLSPEQITGRTVDPACDIFSLGAVLAFAGTGRGPFEAQSVPEMLYRIAHDVPTLDGLPTELAELTAACLAKEPSDRPGLTELRSRLAAGFAPVTAPALWPPPAITLLAEPGDTLPPSRISRRGLLALGATAGAATVLGAGVWELMSGGSVSKASARPVASASASATGPASKTVLWKFAAPAEPNSMVLVSNDELYVAAGQAITVLDPRTGHPTRTLQLPAAARDMAVLKDSVYVVSGPKDLLALDSTTGNQRWKYTVDHPGDFGIIAIVEGNTAYVGSGLSTLIAVDLATGHPRWTLDTPGSLASLTLSSGVLYAGSWDNAVYAIDPTTGHKHWRSPTAAHVNDVAVADSGVFGAGEDGVLYALDPTGKQRWKYHSDVALDRVSTSPGLVYAMDDGSALYAVDALSGRERWRFIGGGAFSNAVVTNDIVLAGGGDSALYALGVADGKQRWKFETTGGLTSIELQNGIAFLADYGKTVYALRL